MITTPLRTGTLSRGAARTIGRDAAIYGYPFVEMLRMCRVQTTVHTDAGCIDGVAMNVLRHWEAAEGTQPGVCVSAWLQLSDGPCRLRFPAGRLPADPSLRLSLYDACSENFARIGSNDATGYDGELVLIGPHAMAPMDVEPRHLLRCPTNFMWLVGCVQDSDPWVARAQADRITLTSLRGVTSGRRPAAVDLWQGDPVDAFRVIAAEGATTASLAPNFYANLSNALAHVRIADGDRPLLQRFREAGLWPGPASDRRGLSDDACRGLAEGLADAVQLMQGYVASPQQFLPLGLLAADTVGGRHMVRAAAVFRGIASGPGEPFA